MQPNPADGLVRTIDDEAVEGSWSITDSAMTSDLRGKSRGAGWCGGLALAVIMLVGWLVILVCWLAFDQVPRPWTILSACCNTVTAAVVWGRFPGRRRTQFGASPSRIWMRTGSSTRYYDWNEIGQITCDPASSQSLRISLRPAGGRVGVAMRVARPVAEQFLAEADGRGVAIRSTVPTPPQFY